MKDTNITYLIPTKDTGPVVLFDNNDIKNININPIERIIYNKWLTRKERLS